ncbi:NADPH:quinone reductase [Roseibium sp.]|uniref:NADPH:quinone reductase n=1 Tax=Roseibium sp. TaxID=1936156 RepID=UPI003B520452
MKAAYYETNGPANDVFIVGELDDPKPAHGEVLVEVATSAVNPSDAKSRAGVRGPMAFDRVIPHSDGAGRIVAVGDSVNEERIGERVWLWNAGWKRAHGSNGTLIALHEEQAVYLPEEASFEDGACLGIPALTAHRCLFADGAIDGQDILVTGGAGTVGSYAIQMAKLRGARVFTTVSSEEKAAHARQMGADVVLNYRTDDVAENILEATSGKGVERIVEVEFGGNLATSRKVLAQNGTIAAYGSMADPEPKLPFYPMMFDGQTLRMVLVYILPEAARTAGVVDITGWLTNNDLQHPVARTFSLDQTAEAHAFVEAGTKIGTTVIKVADI